MASNAIRTCRKMWGTPGSSNSYSIVLLAQWESFGKKCGPDNLQTTMFLLATIIKWNQYMYFNHYTFLHQDLDVQMYDCQESPDYTVRKLDLTNRKEINNLRSSSREIIHVQYTSWPDRSAPEDPAALLQLIDVTRSLASQYAVEPSATGVPTSTKSTGASVATASSAPWLVHCSAGVGRTGE